MLYYKLFFVGFFQSLIWRSISQVAVTCSCDLTGNACDANCCCDPDCTSAEIGVFQCSTDAFNEDSRLCFNELVYVNNIDSTIQQDATGVFCIITQRDPSWNFYVDPQYNITTSQAFSSLQQQYGSYTYNVASGTTVTESTYQSGDTIDIRYTSNSLSSTFSLPVPGPTGQCLDYNPASFLDDQTISCARRFSDLSSSCTSGSVLDSDYYLNTFEIATTPVNSSDTTSSTFISVTTCDGLTPASISYDSSSVCRNVPTSISYTIRYDGSQITSACVSFPSVSDITSTELLQTFSIVFITSETVDNSTAARSGNPGYVIGYPLRTGIMGTTDITLDSTVLTLLIPNADGSCLTIVSQDQIKFREDSRTGCLISFNSSQDCTELDSISRAILNVPSTNTRVAAYGNTLTNETSDWVQVVVSGNAVDVSGNTTSSPCQNVVVGINYEVLFANTGSLSNPQTQVISIQYSLVTQSVQFECIGSSCSSGAASSVTQPLEVSSSVSFTDISLLPQPVLRVRPTIDARLAADFFYPFTVTGNP